MRINQWLQYAQAELQSKGISTPRLDSLLLLEDTLEMDRIYVLANPDYELSAKILNKLKNLLTRRAQHEPMAYIRGHCEFYGYDFVITPSVLVPRPESETMIELLKVLVDEKSTTKNTSDRKLKERKIIEIADIGTGSGALGITAQLELPMCKICLLDIDRKALKVAKTNVDKFTLSISVIESNLLQNTHVPYDILLCNLPYVPDDYQINKSATLEPEIALYGGSDGLNIYLELFQQVKKLENQPLFILTESFPRQHKTLTDIAASAGYDVYQKEDFIQVFVLKQRPAKSASYIH